MALGNTHIIWTPGTTLEQIERQAIELSFAFFRNKSSAARALGINVRTLEIKLKKYVNDDRELKRVQHDLQEDRLRLLAAQRGEVYEPIPYEEPPEDEEPLPMESTPDEEDDQDIEDAPRTFAQQKLKDGPPVIPPAASQLSAKIVGAR